MKYKNTLTGEVVDESDYGYAATQLGKWEEVKVMSIESGGYYGSNSAYEQPQPVMIRMDTQHKYRVSRDYKWLWQLCHKTPIICIVSYLDCRDIACTLVYGDTVQVSSRGISYIYARDEDDFIKQCTQSFLEWMMTDIP